MLWKMQDKIFQLNFSDTSKLDSYAVIWIQLEKVQNVRIYNNEIRAGVRYMIDN